MCPFVHKLGLNLPLNYKTVLIIVSDLYQGNGSGNVRSYQDY